MLVKLPARLIRLSSQQRAPICSHSHSHEENLERNESFQSEQILDPDSRGIPHTVSVYGPFRDAWQPTAITRWTVGSYVVLVTFELAPE
jgi:hypothetical protein